MKVMKAAYEILPRTTGESSVLMTEKIARVCYKSEDKIKEGSAVKMIAKLVENGHLAMLEHRQIIVELEKGKDIEALYNALKVIELQCGYRSYLKVTAMDNFIVSGNIRAWLETFSMLIVNFCVPSWMVKLFSQLEYAPFFLESLVKYEDAIKSGRALKSGGYREITDWNELSAEERLIHERLSVKFIVDRGVSHELVRHRPASFAQESTRYCNYGNSDDGITVIEPCFFDNTWIPRLENDKGEIERAGHWFDKRYAEWHRAMGHAEGAYLGLLRAAKIDEIAGEPNDIPSATPQEARTVLPNSLKTEIVMTTTLSHWQHIFNLRAFGTTGTPHPQMKEVMEPLFYELYGSKEYEGIFNIPAHK